MHMLLPPLLLDLSRSHQTLLKTKQLHAIIIMSRLSHDAFFATKILRFYAINNELYSSHLVFNKCTYKSVFLWNSMIRAYARNHEFHQAFSLFTLMRNSETRPDNFTFACVLLACCEKFDPCGAKTTHGSIIVSGLVSDSVAGSALVKVYSKLGLVTEARRVFDEMPEQDLVLWNSMLSGYGYGGFWHKGLGLLSVMRNSGKMPDGYTFVGLVSCFRDPSLLEIGKGVHGFCLKIGFVSEAHVGSALVSMYSRCNCLDSAHQIFNSLSRPDLVLWSAMVTGFSQCGEWEEALVLFMEMNMAGKTPDPVLIASVLVACARLTTIRPGKEIHGYVFRHGFELKVLVSSALIDMYAKCGFAELGIKVFEIMPEKSVVTYNSVISCLGSHGLARKAIEMFEEMLEKGLEPDRSTFSALLYACCHPGMVNDGRNFFRRMEDEFKITASIEHYVYMVKLLGMVGELEEAYNLIQTMPILPDSGVWGALLAGCSIHGNVKLGEIVARRLFEIEPEKTAYRILLSNIYAANGRWDDVKILRDEMMDGGLQKTAGLSWIEYSI